MRNLLPILVIAACSSASKPPPTQPVAAAAAVDLAVLRWVPSSPTYLFASAKLSEAQQAVRQTIDAVGVLAGTDARETEHGLEQLLATNPLSDQAARSLGIDLDGSIAMFSEDIEPTFVLHLAAPDALRDFIGKQRIRGMVAQSVSVDGVDVFTAALGTGLNASWAIDRDWFFLHFGRDTQPAARWFEHAHAAGKAASAASWAADWAWAKAQAAGSSAIHGYVKVHDLVVAMTERARNAAACARLLAPIARASLSIGVDGKGGGSRVAIDLGPAAKDLAKHVLAPPPGWASAAGDAALAVEVNLDVDAFADWITPCADTFGVKPGDLQTAGVRAGRAMLLSFDPNEPTGTGAVAIDLASKTAIAGMLDQIPMRSHFEKDRQFGGRAGHHLSVPMVASFDYVLDDHFAAAAMGDGVLARVLTASGPGPMTPRLFAIDLAPPKLSAGAWEWLLKRAGVRDPRALVERLSHWHDGHLAISIDGDALVLDAAGHLR